MKKFLFLLVMLFTLSSCVATTSVVHDDIYDETTTESVYYNDALYVNYEIVWVAGWPYWYRDCTLIPYHHHHVYHWHPGVVMERRTYRPHLHRNHYVPRRDPYHKDFRGPSHNPSNNRGREHNRPNHRPNNINHNHNTGPNNRNINKPHNRPTTRPTPPPTRSQSNVHRSAPQSRPSHPITRSSSPSVGPSHSTGNHSSRRR